MIRRPPGATRAATRLPYTTLFRSPACRRYPVPSLIAASRPMIAVDIVAGRPPYRLATGVEKAKPHHDIIGVGAKRMTRADPRQRQRSEEHTSELQSLMRISYAVFCLKKKIPRTANATHTPTL